MLLILKGWCGIMSRYSNKVQYRKPLMNEVEKLLSHIPSDCVTNIKNRNYPLTDKDALTFWTANLETSITMCSGFSSEEYNALLSKHKVSLSKFVKRIGTVKTDTNINNDISSAIRNLIVSDKLKKKPFIKVIRGQFPEVSSGVVCRILNKLISNRVIEIDRTFKTKPLLVEGKYWEGNI